MPSGSTDLDRRRQARGPEDIGLSRWPTFQRAQGCRLRTRPVGSIDRGVSLNRALWMRAEAMRKLKG